MRHNNLCFKQMGAPIEFIETDGAAVQLMNTIEISIDLNMLTIQIKTTISNAITNPANCCTEIWIGFWAITYMFESQK